MSGVEHGRFGVRLGEWREIHALPGDWPPAELRALLETLEVPAADVADADLGEMVELALGDLDRDDAADVVLRRVFGEKLSAGRRQNLVGDLEGDRPWEDHADLAEQAGLFRAVGLLQRAFPKHYGIPDAALARVEILARDADAAAELPLPRPAVLWRVLAAGMDGGALVRRLFPRALAGSAFPEAPALFWHCELRENRCGERPPAVVLETASSLAFLGPLEKAGEWEARVPLGETR